MNAVYNFVFFIKRLLVLTNCAFRRPCAMLVSHKQKRIILEIFRLCVIVTPFPQLRQNETAWARLSETADGTITYGKLIHIDDKKKLFDTQEDLRYRYSAFVVSNLIPAPPRILIFGFS